MSNHTLVRCCLLVTIVAGGLTCLIVRPSAAGGRAEEERTEKGGLVTLYALDPLARTFSFGDGQYGHVFQDHEVRNRASDIDFTGYRAGHFSVGIEGGRLGIILDLGTADDLRKAYGYGETVGNGQGFASIRRQGDKVLILKDSKERTSQELKEAEPLFRAGRAGDSAAVNLGHVYLVRLTERRDKSFERIVKFLVVSYKEGESVTLRWQLL
jgi:hypothetical protein